MPGTGTTPSRPIRAIVASSTIEQCSIRWRGIGRAWVGRHRRLVGVEDEVDRGVADGVDRDLEAGAVGAVDLGLEVLGLHHPETDVVRLALVRPAHPRRPPADAAVREELDRADPQPRIAEAGGDAQVGQGVEVLVEHHHQVGADRQPTRAAAGPGRRAALRAGRCRPRRRW